MVWVYGGAPMAEPAPATFEHTDADSFARPELDADAVGRILARLLAAGHPLGAALTLLTHRLAREGNA